jgi:peptidoglycan/LPS O-acetylase OafA/YrhL
MNQNVTQEQQTYFPALDGLRGITALWVTIFHVYLLTLRSPKIPLPFLFGWVGNGHFAVDVFIVLSGFCLMLPVLKHNGLKGGFLLFYKRRVIRILPPLYAALVLALLIRLSKSLLTGESPYLDVNGLFSSVFLIQDLIPEPNYLIPALWSVCLEIRIYFLFPVLVNLFFRFGKKIILPFTTIFLLPFLAFVYYRDSTNRWEISSQWYYVLFGLGMLAATHISQISPINSVSPIHNNKNRRPLLISLAALISTSVGHYLLQSYPVQQQNIGLPFLDVFMGVATVYLILDISKENSITGKFLGGKIIKNLGKISYSFYLVNVPIIKLINGIVSARFSSINNNLLSLVLLSLIEIAACLAVTLLFYRFIEVPSLNLARRMKDGMAPKLESKESKEKEKNV